VFFSASGSKLPSYILPMFAPLALVIGWLLAGLEARTLFRLLLPLVVVGTALALGLVFAYDRYAPEFATARMPAEILVAFGAWVKASAVIAAAGGILALVALRRAPRKPELRLRGIAILAFASLGALQVGVAGFDTFSPMRSSSAILRAAQAVAPFSADAPFYQIAMYDQTVPFYLGRATRGVAFRHELAFGIDAEPAKQIPTIEAWVDEWRGLAQGYAILVPAMHERLAAEGVPMRELARDPRNVVVSRQ
jgi:4-amino-4-deoxy-L-arabinose transferase-like glycosyltransferase